MSLNLEPLTIIIASANEEEETLPNKHKTHLCVFLKLVVGNDSFDDPHAQQESLNLLASRFSYTLTILSKSFGCEM